MMYVCDDCGAIFDAPEIKRWKEYHEDGWPEEWAAEVCPICGCDGIEELQDAETSAL